MIGPPIFTPPGMDQRLLTFLQQCRLKDELPGLVRELGSVKSDYVYKAMSGALGLHATWLLGGRHVIAPDDELVRAAALRPWGITKGDTPPNSTVTFAMRFKTPLPPMDGHEITGIYLNMDSEDGFYLVPISRVRETSMPVPGIIGRLPWESSSDKFEGKILWRIAIGVMACFTAQLDRVVQASRKEIRKAPHLRGLHGCLVRTLRYDPAAWAVIVQKQERGEPRDLGGTHATPAEHVVREHESLYWVRNPGEDEVLAFDVSSAGNALFGVKRPVRAHRRGKGEAGERITRLVRG